MKVAFFTEGLNGATYSRNFSNMRTDVAWQVALNSKNFNHWADLNPEIDEFDVGIIIVPKKWPKEAFDCYYRNKNFCKQWAVMQEGPHELYQDWEIGIQIEYLNLLNSVDIIFCHNECDANYYRGLFDNRVEILPTLMIEDAIPEITTRDDQRTGVMVGGNWCSWYSGQDSTFIASEFQEPIFMPSMGRKTPEEYKLKGYFGITHIPYLTWADWIKQLSQRKYAVHLMRTYAAGTFALNCAYLGIPCIGYESLDTQRICFPELTVKEGDLKSASKIVKHLISTPIFYEHVSAYAKKAWKENFHETVFMEKFQSYFK